MQGFSGFPRRGRLTRIPGMFFSDVLPHIDSLPELKVTLYAFWRLQQKEGGAPFLRRREFAADETFMRGLGPREDAREEALDDGLERAAARGTLLHVRVEEEGGDWTEDLYFVNTARGRAAVEAIEEGTWRPTLDPSAPVDVNVERPNVFTLYEQNIGPLTPLIADSLRDLEETYAQGWIEEAFRIAVQQNKRSLAYIEAILRRWHDEGRDDSDRRGQDWRYYSDGPYADDSEY
jgi:DNA replication protein